jgi:hypothetical protein
VEPETHGYLILRRDDVFDLDPKIGEGLFYERGAFAPCFPPGERVRQLGKVSMISLLSV